MIKLTADFRFRAVAAALTIFSASQPAVADDNIVRITESARKSTVFIKFYREDPQTGGKDWAFGSGFIAASSGLVVTAHHVIKPWLQQAAAKQDPEQEKASNPLLGLIGSISNPSAISMTYLYGSEVADIALLKLRSPQDYSVSDVCFAASISSGQQIIAFGFPFGKEFTPIIGLLSNDDAPEGRWSANINFTRGTSGGPVYDTKTNKVIGIVKGGLEQLLETSSIDSGAGASASVPVTAVQYVTPIIRSKTALIDHGLSSTCDTNGPPDTQRSLLSDASPKAVDLLRQQEELFVRLNLLLKNRKLPIPPFALDTLARRYEGQASTHVGVDASGNYYFGAYRLKAGIVLDGFLSYLSRVKPDYAKRLELSGGSAAATVGKPSFISEWRALSQSDEFDLLQRKFIQHTNYDRLAARLRRPVEDGADLPSGLGLNLSSRSLALRAVIFSVSVQYGPSTPLPFQALNSLSDLRNKDDDLIIKAIYAERDKVSLYFPDIKSDAFVNLIKQRNSMELEDALFILSKK